MSTAPANWLISAEPDPPTVTPDWEAVGPSIEGVAIREVRHVVTDDGVLTEVFRADWGLPGAGVEQVFCRVLDPRAVTAWHCHAVTTDRLFCIAGRVLIVLYDGRADSSSARTVMQLRTGTERPALVAIPPGVWHGVMNLSHTSPAVFLNAVDHAYAYEAPDHWRIPAGSPDIPFDFGQVR